MDVWLGEPPAVASIGRALHGTNRRSDRWLLPDLWQLHLYDYRGELEVDGVRHEIAPGFVSLVPPRAAVRFRYRGPSEHLYAHLRIRRRGAPVDIPVMQDAAAEAPLLTVLLQQAVAAFAAAPARTTAEVWAVLWRVASLTPAAVGPHDRPHARPRGRPHTAVANAIAFVEANLARPLTVPDVARAAGVSHNHLTRLFRAETGSSVVAYIRRRRMDRARHLLQASTLSISAVAATVGVADLQAFNKACRRELGGSPRAIRTGT